MKYFDSIKEWQRIKNDYENSGLSVKEYCKLKNISRSSFYRNVSALKEINMNTSIERLPDKLTIYINGNKVEFDPTIDDITLSRVIMTCCKLR